MSESTGRFAGRKPAAIRLRLPSRADWRELAIAGLHLAVLWSFAFAQPLFDLLGDSPEFFVARQNTRGDIIVLALALTFIPPLALTGLEALAEIVSPKLRLGLHLLLVAVLVAAFVLQVLKGSGGASAALISISALVGLLAAVLYARSRAAPTLLTVLGPAPLVFLGVFLLISPVSKLVLPGGDVETSRAAIPRETPVVMIVFDEFSGWALTGRDGRIDALRYPNFARLARNATWYRNATSVADFTPRAVPALLSGRVPNPEAAPIASDYPENVFTLLGGKYAFDVTEPSTDLCPERLCPETEGRPATDTRLRELASDLSVVSLHLLLPDDLSRDLPRVDRTFGGFRQFRDTAGGSPASSSPGASARAFAAFLAVGERIRLFREFNRRLASTPAGAHFSFLHVQLPHAPYHFLPSGQRYPDSLGDLPGLGVTWDHNRWLARQGFQRYLLQVGYADRLLGKAMAALRSSGRYDRALVVVVADHGGGFVPGQSYRAATVGNLPSVGSIPFFLKAPGQRRGRIDDANVKSIDVLPTLADRLGIRLPWELEGRPADQRGARGRVFLQPQGGADNVSISFRDFVRRRDDLVDHMAADFGEERGGLYSSGPDPDLVGRSGGALAARAASKGSFELDGSGLLSSVDPHGAVVPAFLTGRVSGVPSSARLAIAVNGRVAAVTVPFEDGDVTHFSAIVSPRSFVRGQNSVEVIVVTGAGSDRRLERLHGSKLGYRLVRDGDGEAIVDSSGRRIEVDKGAVQGSVDELGADNAQVTVNGWAGATNPARAAQLVIAFADDRFLAAGRPSGVRQDVAESVGPGLRRAGFRLGGGVAKQPKTVRVYAVIGRRASQLPLPNAP